MRVARVTDAAGRSWIARLEGDEVQPIIPDEGRFGHDALRDAISEGVELANLSMMPSASPPFRLRAPIVAPQKILAVGLNYADHARESGIEPPADPVIFAKAPSSIIGPDEPIRYRQTDTAEVDYEAELAVVIGTTTRGVEVSEALDRIFGYLVCNDVSARDAQFSDGQWVRGKSFDTFCPLGPWITTTDEVPDPQSLGIWCRVNGATLQDSSTKEMIFGVAEIISYLSRSMTLMPGDVIATGTPVGVGFARRPPVFLRDGDVVEVEVEGLGILRNPVACS